MSKIRVGVVGTGTIGRCHIDALRRIGCVEVNAVSDIDNQMAERRARDYYIKKCYSRFEELIADPEISVIHNCTPNNMHLPINKMAILAGKHVFSEKPLASNVAETGELVKMLKQGPQIVAGVNFCYRMNPLIQDAKNRIASGEIGRPVLVHGSFLQDCLLFDTDYNWRVEPELTGISRCVSDIGSHWIDTAQILINSRIIEVCANTLTSHPIRKKQNSDGTYEKKIIVNEDYAGILVKFENGATGVFQCSEISAGHKCFIDIEINGSLASFQWQQETSDRMWKGRRDENNEIIMRNPKLMAEDARKFSYLAAGHPEGWNDALRNNVQAFYNRICGEEKTLHEACDFATFQDGHYVMRVVEAIIKSGRERRWIPIDEI